MTNSDLEYNVQNICKITWSDKDTDERITSITEDAIVHMHDLLGMPGEPSPDAFLRPGTTKMLFENYCLYCWNDVPDEFEKNYLSDILKVRRRNEVAAANEQKKSEVS